MPTIFSHGAVGFSVQRLALPRPDAKLLAASILLPMLPDVDALFISRIPYGAMLGHRGFTHSLFFAAVVGLLVSKLFTLSGSGSKRDFAILWLFFAAVIASHGFFDAMTDGGLGVAFFSPFSNERYFFPWRPIPVAPLSVGGLFTSRGLMLMKWELALFGPIALGSACIRSRFRYHIVCAVVCFAVTAAAWIARLLGTGGIL